MGQIESLKLQLALLAAEPDVQITHLTGGDIHGCVDELALDYDAVARNAEFMLNRGELTKDQYECIKRLDEYLSEMSGTANAHLWTPEGLHSTEAWRDVRRIAAECLGLFR